MRPWTRNIKGLKREMLDGKKAAAREILQLKNDHKEMIKMLKENSKLEIVALKKESKNSNDIALDKLKRGELRVCVLFCGFIRINLKYNLSLIVHRQISMRSTMIN